MTLIELETNHRMSSLRNESPPSVSKWLDFSTLKNEDLVNMCAINRDGSGSSVCKLLGLMAHMFSRLLFSFEQSYEIYSEHCNITCELKMRIDSPYRTVVYKS